MRAINTCSVYKNNMFIILTSYSDNEGWVILIEEIFILEILAFGAYFRDWYFFKLVLSMLDS